MAIPSIGNLFEIRKLIRKLQKPKLKIYTDEISKCKKQRKGARILSHSQCLPEKCQLVFLLSREEGHSQKEIAEALGISTKTVETHINKALRTIRASIQQFLFSLF